MNRLIYPFAAAIMLAACDKGPNLPEQVHVSDISLSEEALSLAIGEKTNLYANVIPDNATDKTVRWTSDNASVTVSDTGEVTAVARGAATITATADGGITATCKVIVETGVTIAGVTWATRNGGKPGEFVAAPEDYGNYYTFDEARKVCPFGWSPGGFESLAASGSEWATLNGVNGRWFGSGDNRVFLPAAGQIISRGRDVSTLGVAGYYWDGSQSFLSPGTNLGYMTFRSGYVDSYRRYNGESWFTVRCVRK